eukprot:CAMPEP_0203914530 /NCGR_PEP_ID=MMETSP0359-20131031/55407_1 /ASSEMBLY_ACC=CAM_ASM_000338 /TAXON_ID=268821 /ORGANISM="Scrippsiella Hangoei, Strain SHTV-5" /LENGTH=57 /DNA_ID=CAMNT_0050840859 /DNA_START=26 /DNA_END=199 /DNA_ORIENTATION=+
MSGDPDVVQSSGLPPFFHRGGTSTMPSSRQNFLGRGFTQLACTLESWASLASPPRHS